MLTSLQALMRLGALRWLGVFICALATLLATASTASALEPAQTKTRVWGFDFAEHNSVGLLRAASGGKHQGNRLAGVEEASGSLLAAKAAEAARAADAPKAAEAAAAAKKVVNGSSVGPLPKPPTGPGSVPKAQRDPKRGWNPPERAKKRETQGGKCANGCGKDIDAANSRGHHKKRHADGGKTDDDNHAEVCIDCHKDLHSPDDP